MGTMESSPEACGDVILPDLGLEADDRDVVPFSELINRMDEPVVEWTEESR
jgi:hypothetical protein